MLRGEGCAEGGGGEGYELLLVKQELSYSYTISYSKIPPALTIKCGDF